MRSALRPVPYPVITVGGTNGKGSTVAHRRGAAGGARPARRRLHLARICCATTSASASTAREASDAELIAAFERIEAARGATTLTFFEYNTLAALLIFAAQRDRCGACSRWVSAAGSMPPTSSTRTSRCCVSVGLDHRDWLGDTLESIGARRPASSGPGRPAVLGSPEMPRLGVRRDRTLGARPRHRRSAILPGRSDDGKLELSRPCTQATPTCRPRRCRAASNIETPPAALAAVAALASSADARCASSSRRRCARFGSPGACRLFRVRWSGFLMLRTTSLRRECSRAILPSGRVEGRTFAVTGILRDKDAAGIGRALAAQVDRWILCSLPGPRGSSIAAELG